MLDIISGLVATYKTSSVVNNVQPTEVLISLRTRFGTYCNAYDSTGSVSAGRLQAHPDPAASDEIFRLIDLNGGALAHIPHPLGGDR
jgi:hypothetical protein